MESASIKPISRNSVHKICSGQVVLTLATAVKELVENSLDAGATIIEVKLKGYGSDLIEVIDNGKGVKESDFQAITLKHHTSKISDFSDVQFVNTFGFRGEALSSLCALSDVEITTCHSNATMGTLLIYDRDGTLIKSSPTHRQVGTTVTLKKLFHPLAVRHKEFLRNIQREFAKMVQLLTAYCLISVGRKISCSNVTDKGKKNIVLSTHSGSTVKDNITCIFGSKQADDLLPFVQHVPAESDLEEYSLPSSVVDRCDMYRLEGFVSSCVHGTGRSSTDRQFFYVDGRPCDMPKVSKVLNEVYHQFNKLQYPFVLIDVVTQSGAADVNVTPDKRQIFVQDEKLLLCIFKASLYRMYRSTQNKVTSATLSFPVLEKPATSPGRLPVQVDTPKRKSSPSRRTDSPPAKVFRFNKGLTADVLPGCTQSSTSLSQVSVTLPYDADKITPGLKNIFCHKQRLPVLPASKSSALHKFLSGRKDAVVVPEFINDNESKHIPNHELECDTNDKPELDLNGESQCDTNDKPQEDPNGEKQCKQNDKPQQDLNDESQRELNENPQQDLNAKSQCVSSDMPQSLMDASWIHPGGDLDEPCRRRRRIRVVTFNMENLKGTRHSRPSGETPGDAPYRRFRSRICPAENASAEQELSREIRKEDFSEMHVIGQFNLGFIVSRLRDDLFIIDQHATDEKYHYETLRREETIETQPLVTPQPLKLTAASECVLLDHLAVFEKSGFRFATDESAPAGERVRLTSVPVGHHCTFGKEDVDEMIFMLTDNPVTSIRPSRVNRMFASRACRSSVMIGTPLSRSHMKKLLVHMGEIEQPWNCPHGRPTIRHLFNLGLLH